MNSTVKKSVSEVISERKSVRKYTDKKIPKETMNEIFQLAGKAPSSWNLQHWKFIDISSQEAKDRVIPQAINQSQAETCSNLIVVLADKEAYKNGEKIYSQQVECGYMTSELKEMFLETTKKAYTESNGFDPVQDAVRAASLAAMQLMLAAKSFGVDSCPMIGFNKMELIKALNIPDRYIPIMMISLGYADEEGHPTLRFSIEDTVIRNRF